MQQYKKKLLFMETHNKQCLFAAVATILNKIKRPYTTVGVDGSVYKCHPHFHDLMEKKIEELTAPDYKVRITCFFK